MEIEEGENPNAIYRKLETEFTSQDKARLTLIYKLLKVLNLDNFEIHLLTGEPLDPSNLVSITRIPGYNLAGIAFRYDFDKLTKREQLQTIIHELTHLYFERADSAIDSGIQLLPIHKGITEALDQISLNYHFGMEQGVEMVSRTFTKLLIDSKQYKFIQDFLSKKPR